MEFQDFFSFLMSYEQSFLKSAPNSLLKSRFEVNVDFVQFQTNN